MNMSKEQKYLQLSSVVSKSHPDEKKSSWVTCEIEKMLCQTYIYIRGGHRLIF